MILATLVCMAVVPVVDKLLSPPGSSGGLAFANTGAANLARSSSALMEVFPPEVAFGLFVLVGLSAFFSASEVAYFSIHQLRLRGMAEEPGISGRLVASLMLHPGRLLTTILVGNSTVNVLISVLLPSRVERFLVEAFGLPTALGYFLTIVLSTAILVFFGEVTPKVFAVHISEAFARGAAIPLVVIDRILSPVRWALIHFTDFIFKITRFDDIKAAPFITDDEFRTVLSEGESHGVIEEEEGQMIQGILQFGDAVLREVLVPRPNIAALSHDSTVGEALNLYKERGFSRMPVYEDDLDHVRGIVFAKDLLPSVFKGKTGRKVSDLMRPARFVPETMTVANFVKDAQRTHTHLAIVVDEYGGTEGIVTLDDAIEEVVGVYRSNSDAHDAPVEELDAGMYRVDGSLSLDELSELVGVRFEDEEHETVAGFVMGKANKIPEMGDTMEYGGVLFTVEEVEGKRASTLRVEKSVPASEEAIS